MTIRITRPEVEALINQRLQSGAFKDAEDVILQALQASPSKPAEQNGDPRPIWDVILDNMKDVPAEEFAKLPKDGASEVDHYLYGHPKRNQ
jgi:Arc/MetJ-type ribon-helix-helix transcriptional regulator